MRFLLYDRILRIEKGRRIVGIKSLPLSEEFFGRHFSRGAVAPGVIFIEALAQLTGWLIIYSHDFEIASLLVMVEDARLPAALPQGGTVELCGEIVSQDANGTVARGRVTCDGREIASVGRFLFAHFADPPKDELRRRFAYYGGFQAEVVEPAPVASLAAASLAGQRRVVVTGLGAVTALGVGVPANWRRLLEGRSGIRAIDPSGRCEPPAPFAAQVCREDYEELAARHPEEAAVGERRTLFALSAAQEAMDDAGLLSAVPLGDRAGVSVANGVGAIRPEDILVGLTDEGRFDPREYARNLSGLHPESMGRHPIDRAARLIGARYGMTGANVTTTSACAAGAHAVGAALRMIRRGDLDVALVGGADSMIHPIGNVFFVLLGAAAPAKAGLDGCCRPFDRRRCGLVMGEGAGMAVLESEERARGRGARIYAEVVGYGCAMEAHELIAPHPGGRGTAEAMAEALRDGGVRPDEVDYINAHGTGTRLNDPAETASIKHAFGDHARSLAISSSKSMIGHLLGACGAVEFVITVLSVYHDAVHPTIHLTQPDPRCDLDYVSEGCRRMPVRVALSNSSGFGGQNAAILLRKRRATWDKPR